MGKLSSELKKLEKKANHFRHYRENTVSDQPVFTKMDAALIAKALKINFENEKFDLEQFTKGINVELEHGSKFPECNVTKNDPIITGKIAWAHLKEIRDYYDRLDKLEQEARDYWSTMA